MSLYLQKRKDSLERMLSRLSNVDYDKVTMDSTLIELNVNDGLQTLEEESIEVAKILGLKDYKHPDSLKINLKTLTTIYMQDKNGFDTILDIEDSAKRRVIDEVKDLEKRIILNQEIIEHEHYSDENLKNISSTLKRKEHVLDEIKRKHLPKSKFSIAKCIQAFKKAREILILHIQKTINSKSKIFATKANKQKR